MGILFLVVATRVSIWYINE